MAHISKLPREVLTAIFLALRDLYAVVYDDYSNAWFRRIYRWYTDTKLVCRLWRAVARQCCYLWDVVEFSLHQRHAIIGKAKAMPLTVIYNPRNGGKVPALFRGYYDYVPRIKSLTVVGANNWRAPFSKVKALPKLRELRLYRQAEAREDKEKPIPNFFRRGKFPVLSTIDLCGYSFDTRSTIFSRNIRSLRLAFPMDVSVTHNLTEENVSELLRNMPLLESLALHGALREFYKDRFVDPAQEPNCARITLPHLRSLSVSSPVPCCVLLLASLVFPSTTHVDILSICVNLNEWPYVARLFKLLRSKLDGSDTLGTYEPVRSLIVQNSPIPNESRSLMFMHCLRTEYPCGEDQMAKNFTYFSQALAYPRYACKDPAREVWQPEKMLGVRLVLMSAPSCMAFPDKSFSTFCRDWPLKYVRTCAVGPGYVTIPELRHTCPRTRVLFLDTERYATDYGYTRDGIDCLPPAELLTPGPNAEVILLGADTQPLHPPKHLKELHTIVLLRPPQDCAVQAVSVIRYHLQQLIRANILTTVVGEIVILSPQSTNGHLESMEFWHAPGPRFNIAASGVFEYAIGKNLYA